MFWAEEITEAHVQVGEPTFFLTRQRIGVQESGGAWQNKQFRQSHRVSLMSV